MKKYNYLNIFYFSMGISILVLFLLPVEEYKYTESIKRYGFVDSIGDLSIFEMYDDYKFSAGDSFLIQKNQEWYYVNQPDELVKVELPPKSSYLSSYYSLGNGLYEFEEYNFFDEKKYGIKNAKGEVVISAKFDDISSFHNGMARVEKGGKAGYINSNGDYVHKPKFYIRESPRKLNGPHPIALAVLNKSTRKRGRYRAGKYGYMDENGTIILDFKFSSASKFKENVAVVRVEIEEFEFHYGLIDPSGNYIVPPSFDYIGELSEGLLAAAKDWQWGFINKRGEWHIRNKYQKARKFSEGLAPVRMDDFWGFVNRNGRMVIEAKFDEVEDFNNGFAIVKLKGKRGLIDKAGKFICPPKYSSISFLNDNIIQATDSNFEHTIYDNKGNLVFNSALKYIQEYEDYRDNKYYKVTSSGKDNGIYDVNWNRLLDTSYSNVQFRKHNRILIAKKNGKKIHLNINGEIILSADYEIEKILNDSTFVVKPQNKNKLGLWSQNKGLVIPTIYNKIDSHRKYYEVESGFGTGLIDADGNIVLQPRHRDILKIYSDLFFVELAGEYETKTSETVRIDSLALTKQRKYELNEKALFDTSSQFITLRLKDNFVELTNTSNFTFTDMEFKLELKANSIEEIIDLALSPEFSYNHLSQKELLPEHSFKVPIKDFVHSINDEHFSGTLMNLYAATLNFNISYKGNKIKYECRHENL